MPKVYGHRPCKSLVEVAPKNHTHTAAQVGALPASTVIPDKVSMLENDSGFGYSENFSETPQLTGGTWFDGKPIWRVSKYFKDVAFAGVGQWTAVGELPIDVHSAEINLIDFDMRLLCNSIIDDGPLCIGYRLPIMGPNGYIATPWLGNSPTINYNWVNASTSAKPFDECDVLVTIHYTKNDDV